jgi:hypothetical protein
MFLSNTPLRFPPLAIDTVIGGLLLPAGTEIYKSHGNIDFILISKPWEFPNKHCSKGRAEVYAKSKDPLQLEVGPCTGDAFN